jgi:hypothetical protein
MTPLGRAFLGAACGAVVTLAAHPVSRPYLLETIWHFPPSQCAVAAGLDRALPPPTTPAAAAEWLSVGAEKLRRGISLSKGEIRTLLAIDDEASQVRGDNAFWAQMKAVLLSKMGRGEEARRAWVEGGNCTSWDDFQTSRLLRDRNDLVERIGWNQGWTYGYVFFARTDAAAAEIQRYAQRLVSNTSIESNSDLLLRYATIRNGSLLRDGSRSIKVGTHGWEMVELASYPKSLSGIHSPKRIWIAETTFTSRLRQLGYADQAKQAYDAFLNNEGWLALTGAATPDASSEGTPSASNSMWRWFSENENPDDNLRDLCLVSVVLAGLPGAMAVCSFLSLGCLAVGTVLQRRLEAIRFFPTWTVSLAAFAVGALVLWQTKLWLAAVSVGLAVQFLAIGPSAPRVRKSDDLGPLFGFAIFSIWLIGLCAFGLYLVATSVSANTIGPLLGPAGEYLSSSQIFLAVTAIVLSLIFLITPLWAIVRRYGTPDLLALGLRRFGTTGAIGSLAACVILGPFAVFGDKIVSNELLKIVQNEPIYYLNAAQ